MNERDFIFWLKGFIDASNQTIYSDSLSVIKEELDKILISSPNNFPPIYPSYPNWWSLDTVSGSSASSKDLGVITTNNQDIQ